MAEYFVYAIQSERDGRIYVGFSADVEKRLRDHNLGMTDSTKPWRPWKLVFKQYAGDRKEARKLEKYFKSGYGKEFLKSL